jgi:hypothetical protein
VRNRLGQVKEAQSWSGDTQGPILGMTLRHRVVFGPDSIGRNHSETYHFPGWGGGIAGVSSTFDSSKIEQRAGLSYGSSLTLGFVRDAIGRIRSMSWNRDAGGDEPLAKWAHLGGQQTVRQVTWIDGGAVGKTTRSYDGYARLTEIEDDPINGSADPLARYRFEYDSWGYLTHERYQRQQGQGSDPGDRFAYDEFGRLSKAWLGSEDASKDDPDTVDFLKSLTYGEWATQGGDGLDDAGNRTKVFTQEGSTSGSVEEATYTLDGSGASGSNRYLKVVFTSGGDVELEHDGRGNLRSDGVHGRARIRLRRHPVLRG